VDWTHLAQDRDQWPDRGEHVNKPSGFITFGEFIDLLSDLTYQEGFLSMALLLSRTRIPLNVGLRGCTQKFWDWPPGARTTNGTVLCH
jgi:hypothetical protein